MVNGTATESTTGIRIRRATLVRLTAQKRYRAETHDDVLDRLLSRVEKERERREKAPPEGEQAS